MPQTTTFVGIDVAKDKLDVHLDPSGVGFAVANSAAGMRQLLRRLEKVCADRPGSVR